jgi:hypothetical protein
MNFVTELENRKYMSAQFKSYQDIDSVVRSLYLKYGTGNLAYLLPLMFDFDY